MTELTRADFDALQKSLTDLRIEWRQEMVTHIRWLAGLFVVQFIATVGATAGIIGWMLNVAMKLH